VHDVDAVLQVLLEQALLDPLSQVTVRGADHPQIDLDERLCPQPLYTAILHQPQPPHVHRRRQFGHLIKEQCAAVSLLEIAASLSVSAGERPLS